MAEAIIEYSEVILGYISSNWRSIATIIGLAVLGSVAYTVGSAVVQSQPAFTQAFSITAYVIPLIVYMMAIQFVFNAISMIKEYFGK